MLIQNEGKMTFYIKHPEYIIWFYPQHEEENPLLDDLHMGSLAKCSGRTCWFLPLNVQTSDCQLWKYLTKPNPFVLFACDSHQLKKNSWKWKCKGKAHAKTIYWKWQRFQYCISVSYFSSQHWSLICTLGSGWGWRVTYFSPSDRCEVASFSIPSHSS